MWANRSGRSPNISDVSESLRLLTKIERSWAICSGRSEEMSDRERIAQDAQQNWANEWIARFFEQIAHSLIFGQKTNDSLGKSMSKFPALESSNQKFSKNLRYAWHRRVCLSYVHQGPCSSWVWTMNKLEVEYLVTYSFWHCFYF